MEVTTSSLPADDASGGDDSLQTAAPPGGETAVEVPVVDEESSRTKRKSREDADHTAMTAAHATKGADVHALPAAGEDSDQQAHKRARTLPEQAAPADASRPGDGGSQEEQQEEHSQNQHVVEGPAGADGYGHPAGDVPAGDGGLVVDGIAHSHAHADDAARSDGSAPQIALSSPAISQLFGGMTNLDELMQLVSSVRQDVAAAQLQQEPQRGAPVSATPLAAAQDTSDVSQTESTAAKPHGEPVQPDNDGKSVADLAPATVPEEKDAADPLAAQPSGAASMERAPVISSDSGKQHSTLSLCPSLTALSRRGRNTTGGACRTVGGSLG